MRWAGYVGDKKRPYTVLLGKHEGKRPHGNPIRKWEDNINMNILIKGVQLKSGPSTKP
jgi:hypothetical protein